MCPHFTVTSLKFHTPRPHPFSLAALEYSILLVSLIVQVLFPLSGISSPTHLPTKLLSILQNSGIKLKLLTIASVSENMEQPELSATAGEDADWHGSFGKQQKVLVTQSCLTLCDPMDYSPPGFSVHGILQARTLDWVAISFSKTLINVVLIM